MAITLVPAATICTLLNLTERRVQQLVDEGIIIRPERGRYDLVRSVRGYVEWLQTRAVKGDAEAADDVEKAKLRKLTAEAELAEQKSAQIKGELVAASDVEREWASIFRQLRSSILAIPSRMGAALPHLTKHDIEVLDRGLRRALTDLGTAPRDDDIDDADARAPQGAVEPDPAAEAGSEHVDREGAEAT